MEKKKCIICDQNIINGLNGCGCLICKTCKLCKYGIIIIYYCAGCLTYYGDPKEYCEDHACKWCKLCDQCCIDKNCVWNKTFKFNKKEWPIERLQKCLDECEEDIDDKLLVNIKKVKLLQDTER